MALPLIPFIKIMLLGMVKVVFLGLGAVLVPVTTLRFLLTGASGILLPVLDWLEEHGRLDSARHQSILDDLAALEQVQYTRKEARYLLYLQIVKSFKSLGNNLLALWKMLIKPLRGR